MHIAEDHIEVRVQRMLAIESEIVQVRVWARLSLNRFATSESWEC